MIEVWSLDDGYTDNKGNTGGKTLILPSFVTHWRPKPEKELEEGEKEDVFEHIGVEVNGVKHLVGKGAMKQDPKIAWVGGDNKHTDQNFPIILKTCLGIMSDSPKVILDPLVMGLPVVADKIKDRHTLLETLVVGDHKVKYWLTDGKIIEREICVKSLITKKQPLGSFYDIILDRTGQIKDKTIASQFNVIIDIGSRTLNIYTINALEEVTDLCDTKTTGVFTAYKWVGDFIEDKLGFSVPTGKLPLVVEEKSIRGLDLSPVIQKCYEVLANDIKRIIDEMFIDSWAFIDRIIFTGGGAEVLKARLETLFASKPTMFLGRTATSKGLRKYGVREAVKKGAIMLGGAGVTARIGSQVSAR